jgi:colanic acid biosynthesis glycosyl transferase WcaI
VRIQLWSSNYAPEPTGIGPLAAVWATGLQRRGHEVTVLAAHPHYPEPAWDRPLRPVRRRDAGVRVLRVPLRVGHRSAKERMLQDATLSVSCAAVSPLLPAADVVVAATPCFPALGVAAAHARLRRTPFVVQVHDILPDGAIATGLLPEGRLASVLGRYERACYATASKIVVISKNAQANIVGKGVPAERVEHIHESATNPVAADPQASGEADRPVVFTMGNVGLTQNLEAVVRAFEADDRLAAMGAELVIAGDGVQGDAVRAAIRTDRVRVTGILGPEALDAEARRATVALVSQTSPNVEFNTPSKLMNLMARGLAVVAAVREDSEVGHVLRDSGAGDVVPSDRVATDLGPALVQALSDDERRREQARASLVYAGRMFSTDRVLDRWEALVAGTAADGRRAA